jgi:probable F420-dependent oxidoreductase
MRVAIALPQLGHAAGPDAIRRAAVQAEELGYSHVWANDHITFPVGQSHPSPYMYDPLLTLTTAAAVTETIGIGGEVTAAYYAPLWLANALASLDSLSKGRLTVAVGVGWSKAEFEALGSCFEDRGTRTDEIIPILRAAWNEESVCVDTAHYRSAAVKVLPRPAHRISIWIAGETEPAYRRALALGDGFHGLAGVLPLDTIGDAVARIRRERPDAAAFPFSVYTHDWDPEGNDPDVIRREYDAYVAAGVDHVVSAPWRKDADSWLRTVETLAGLVDIG